MAGDPMEEMAYLNSMQAFKEYVTRKTDQWEAKEVSKFNQRAHKKEVDFLQEFEQTLASQAAALVEPEAETPGKKPQQ